MFVDEPLQVVMPGEWCEAADNVLSAVPEHPLSAGIEDSDNPGRVGRDDQVLRRRGQYSRDLLG
jgi:hypothetical protein